MALRSSPLLYPAVTRAQAILVVNALALDTLVLQAGVFRAHHGVRGPGSIALHPFLGDFYKALVEYSDQLTELAEMLGGESTGSAEEMADGSRLEAWPVGVVAVDEVCELVFDRASVLLRYFELALTTLTELGAMVPVNRVLNIQEGLAVWVWKVGANLELAPDSSPIPPDRLARFGTTGDEVHVGDDGILRV